MVHFSRRTVILFSQQRKVLISLNNNFLIATCVFSCVIFQLNFFFQKWYSQKQSFQQSFITIYRPNKIFIIIWNHPLLCPIGLKDSKRDQKRPITARSKDNASKKWTLKKGSVDPKINQNYYNKDLSTICKLRPDLWNSHFRILHQTHRKSRMCGHCKFYIVISGAGQNSKSMEWCDRFQKNL